MNLNLTEIIFILDRSGSMGGLESDTIGGYNAFLQKQRQAAGEARITTILFDDQYEILHNGVDLNQVKLLTAETYFARGSTALLDAVGYTIHTVGQRLSQTGEDQRPGKVIMVITTDGQENSSHEYTSAKVRDMVRHQEQKYQWEFIFLGANIDAEVTAERMGIRPANAAKYSASSEGTQAMFSLMNENVSCLRNTGHLAKNWKQKLADDHNKKM